VGNTRVRDQTEALIVFADIIESSKFSSILGFEDYANRLLKFQKLFESLGRRYFPEIEDKATELCDVSTRGDEGTIFVIMPDFNKMAELVFRAVEFLFHLKALMYFGFSSMKDDKNGSSAPLRMGVGAGIHVGTVNVIIDLINGHSNITGIEGYSINKAKRIESSSRIGKLSRIALSKEATRLLEGEPILFDEINAPMKGINEQIVIYEVIAGFFENIMLSTEKYPEDEELIKNIINLADKPTEIDEPWLKSLIVSVLEVMLNKSCVSDEKAQYQERQIKLAWHSLNENDPILLYLRAHYYKEKGKHTQQIRYLRKILKKYPYFIFAKKQMVHACWIIAQQDIDRAEKVYARDVAEEFLEKFDRYLTDEEKDEYSTIIRAASNPIKN